MKEPLYWHFKGKYATNQRYDFFTVVTPHMREQTRDRTKMNVETFLEANGIVLPVVWADLAVEQCHWVHVGSFLMYVKRKYNCGRKRWELELISLTPSRHTTTRRRTFAKAVTKTAKIPESSTAFPTWFAEI